MGSVVIPATVRADLQRLAAMAGGSGTTGTGALAGADGAATDVVARAVYASWYLGVTGRSDDDRADRAGGEAPDAALRPEQRRTAALLRAAHADGARFGDGWVVVASDGPVNIVERAGDRRVVRAGDIANLRHPGVPVHPGDEVAVVRRRDSVDPDTGYWVTRAGCGEPEGPIGRLYLNVTLDSVAAVLGRLTASLVERDELPWSLKCPTDPLAYERVDTIVCYVPLAEEEAVRAIARAIVERCADDLVPRVPPLTDPIGPGVAWADDPESAESFGMHRCRALAPAVIRIATDRERGRPVDALVGALADAGIDPSTPWRAVRSGVPA